MHVLVWGAHTRMGHNIVHIRVYDPTVHGCPANHGALDLALAEGQVCGCA